MTDTQFRPTIYALHGCPFTMKTILFLGVTGLLEQFDVVDFDKNTPEEAEARSRLQPHLEKVSYPTVEIAPGEYLNDSGAIIAHYAAEAGVDPAANKAMRFYTETYMPKVGQLYRENMELKARAEA